MARFESILTDALIQSGHNVWVPQLKKRGVSSSSPFFSSQVEEPKVNRVVSYAAQRKYPMEGGATKTRSLVVIQSRDCIHPDSYMSDKQSLGLFKPLYLGLC